MTPQEHELMIIMLAKQRQFIKVLVELLRKKGIAQQEDLPAFEFSVQGDSALRGELFYETRSSYSQAAKVLGIHTDLEGLK
jgi:hypothetical protein